MGQNKAMKIYYEEPKLTLSSLELEGCMCVIPTSPGADGCIIDPLGATVTPMDEWNNTLNIDETL